MALNPRRTAILICDMQERFRNAIHGFDLITHSINKVLKAAAMLEVRVITTEQNPRALGATIAEIRANIDALPAHLNLGTYPKTKFSMLTPEVCKALGPGFSAWSQGQAVPKLGEDDIQHLIVVGIESHVCVMQTSLEALSALPTVPGQRPAAVVLADAVSSVNAAEVPLALARLRAAGADVASSESVLFQLMGDAAHPRFKEFQGLIKAEGDNNKAILKALL